MLLLYLPYGPDEWSRRIDFSWNGIDTVFTTDGEFSRLIITCYHSPKIYRSDDPSPLSTPISIGRREKPRKKIRLPCLDDQHGEVAASCFSYEIVLSSGQAVDRIRRILQDDPGMPSTMHISVQTIKSTIPFNEELSGLTAALSHEWGGALPFLVRFQALKLALNGKLLPAVVFKLLPVLRDLNMREKSVVSCAEALRKLYNELPSPGPHSKAEEFAEITLKRRLKDLSSSYREEGSVYKTVKQHSHLALIHHVRVTPTGVYLEGPEQEVSVSTTSCSSSLLFCVLTFDRIASFDATRTASISSHG